MEKAIRATKTCINQYKTKYIQFETVAIINSQDVEFVRDYIKWCNEAKINYVITESNGTPSKGKNAVLDFLKNSDYDGVSMTDGDDLVYPTGAMQIERHLSHHPNTDVLIVKPSDQVSNYESGHKIGENKFAICWGTNVVCLGYKYGPKKHEIFETGHKAARNLGGHVFYSKKASQLIRYDEEQVLGEDLLLEFNMLKLHQQGKLCFWLSFASDVQMLDRTQQASIQITKNDKEGAYYFERLVDQVKKILPIERSSFEELPVQFPELLMTYDQKIEWLQEVF